MTKATKNAVYDAALDLEAYRFEGIVQPFPSHFHDHYVLGAVTRGRRTLVLRGRSEAIGPGDVLFFAPGESHACSQHSDTPFGYCALNVRPAVMQKLLQELEAAPVLPAFASVVIQDNDIACQLLTLHTLIMEGAPLFAREEQLLLLLSNLLAQNTPARHAATPDVRAEVAAACAYINQHYAERLSLADLCQFTNLSKSTLLRAFTKAKGITPYRYLETIRINASCRLLKAGVSPLEAALETGFSDQSHFTNQFNHFIGLTPGAYREMFVTGTEKGGDLPVNEN